ncbi:unnamed protein product [Rhodiola kirilowii]
MGSSNKVSGKKKDIGKKDKRKSEGSNGGGAKEVVTDARFASVHSDPRFQNIPRREKKVSIDPRFDKIFTDRDFGSSAAPVDKRGRRKEQKENPLQRYYQLEERKEEDGVESEDSEEEQKQEKLKFSGDLKESETEEEDGEVGVRSSDESDDMEEYDSQLSDIEVNTDDEMLIGESDSDTDEQEEEVPEIDQETSRLAAVNLDWHHIKAVDLYALLNSFLPDGGRIRSVSVYPSEFGLQRMNEEAVRGPVGLFDDDNKKSTEKKITDKDNSDNDSESQEQDEEDGDGEDEDASLDESDDGDDNENEADSEDELDDDDDEEEEEEEEEEDKDYIDSKIRNYEKTRLRYYFAVVCCDSIATANHLYKECDGIEIMQSSNKLDLRYIPDSMEFKQDARDVATEVPSDYKPSDFFTKALQLSKPVLTWDEDEPERAKTLKENLMLMKYVILDKLELNEFLASDESDSDDDGADNQPAKKHDKVDAYRSLLSGAGADEDDDNSDGDDGQDMEVTFNTGLEDISKRILERSENKSETVWEAHLRKRKEKRKAKKSKKDSDEESNYSDNDEGIDDFFSDGPQLKRCKGDSKIKSDKKGKDNMEADKEAGASRAELELLLTDDKGTESHAKGYKIKPEKTKGKKGKEVVDDKKIPEADLDDPRFQCLFKNPLFALDPTDPQFKRSAAYRRQLADKQKKAEQDADSAKDETKSPKPSQMPSDVIDKTSKSHPPPSNSNNYEISSLVKSIKMKSKEADKRDKSKLSSVAQSLKKKMKHLIK